MKKLLPLLLCLLLLSACGEAEPASKANFMLDTIVQITLYDQSDPAVIDRAFEEIRQLEGILSVEQEGSDLDRLAKAAGQDWVEIQPETEEVLRLAKKYSALSQGAFDVTTGPLIDLWNIHNGEGHYPSQEELDRVLPLIGDQDLLVEEGRAYLARPGMIANLGAIAKGYIADQVKALLVEQGVEHAVLDLGRNILLIGGRPDGSNFRLGVQDPNQEQGRILGYIEAADKSVVTSGINERRFTYNGQTYHHVLNPATGFPVDNELSAVTILSDRSADGDALSTTCLLLGQEKGLALVESLEGVEALFVTKDGAKVESSGLGSAFAAQ